MHTNGQVHTKNNWTYQKWPLLLSVTLISFTQLSKNASVYVCGLNKKPDFLYFFQKLEQKGKKSSQFWVVIFQFHVCNKWKDIMIKSAIIYMDVLKYQVLFPKGEFLRTHRVGPLGLNGFLHLVLFFRIFHPYEPWPLFSGWWVGGRIFWSNFDFFKVDWKLF